MVAPTFYKRIAGKITVFGLILFFPQNTGEIQQKIHSGQGHSGEEDGGEGVFDGCPVVDLYKTVDFKKLGNQGENTENQTEKGISDVPSFEKGPGSKEPGQQPDNQTE